MAEYASLFHPTSYRLWLLPRKMAEVATWNATNDKSEPAAFTIEDTDGIAFAAKNVGAFVRVRGAHNDECCLITWYAGAAPPSAGLDVSDKIEFLREGDQLDFVVTQFLSEAVAAGFLFGFSMPFARFSICARTLFRGAGLLCRQWGHCRRNQ